MKLHIMRQLSDRGFVITSLVQPTPYLQMYAYVCLFLQVHIVIFNVEKC